MEDRLRTYTRVHMPFPTSPAMGPELSRRALTSNTWSWWARDDGRLVVREFLTRCWKVTAKENKEG